MKRNESQWKRKAARKYCKEQRDKIWDALAGTETEITYKWRQSVVFDDYEDDMAKQILKTI